MARDKALASVQVDNDFTRVTEWRFAPGAETGWHVHEFDYVVVPMLDGRLVIETGDGQQVSELSAGVSYSREAGVRHNVVNGNDHEFVFVEVEFLDRPLRTADRDASGGHGG